MPLQDITPINDQLADIIVRADEPWIEYDPGMAWIKPLWVGPENGASDIHMSHVLGLRKGEPYEFNSAELSTNPLGL